MTDGSVFTLPLHCPVLAPNFLSLLIQPRNGLGLSFHRLEKLDGGTGWLGVGKQGRTPGEGSAQTLPSEDAGGRAAGESAPRNLWGLTSRWRS